MRMCVPPKHRLDGIADARIALEDAIPVPEGSAGRSGPSKAWRCAAHLGCGRPASFC
jgi:hypothetical protein